MNQFPENQQEQHFATRALQEYPIPQLIYEPNQWGLGRGFTWATAPFRIFTNNFIPWLIVSIVIVVLLKIPYVGKFLGLATPILSAGVIFLCNEQALGGDLQLEPMLRKLQEHIIALLILSALFLLFTALVYVPFFLYFGGVYVIGAMLKITTLNIGMLAILAVLALLYYIVTAILAVAFTYAPAFIILHNVSAINAIKMAIKGCFANIFTLIIFSLVFGILALLLSILTFSLGAVLVYPLILISGYVLYREVWTDMPSTQT